MSPCAVSQHFDEPQSSSQRLVILVVVRIIDCQRGGPYPETGKDGTNSFLHVLVAGDLWSMREMAMLHQQ